MSIINCLTTNLPGALINALESEIGQDKAEAFAETLAGLVKNQSWSIFSPLKDIKQLKDDLEKAANQSGIDWGTIAKVATSTAITVAEKCLGFSAIESYVAEIASNPNKAHELETSLATTIINHAKKEGHEINTQDISKYVNLPYSKSDCVTVMTIVCTA